MTEFCPLVAGVQRRRTDVLLTLVSSEILGWMDTGGGARPDLILQSEQEQIIATSNRKNILLVEPLWIVGRPT